MKTSKQNSYQNRWHIRSNQMFELQWNCSLHLDHFNRISLFIVEKIPIKYCVSCVPHLLFQNGQQHLPTFHVNGSIWCVVCLCTANAIETNASELVSLVWLPPVFVLPSVMSSTGTHRWHCAQDLFRCCKESTQQQWCARCALMKTRLVWKSTCYSVCYFWAPSYIDENEAYLGRGHWFDFTVLMWTFSHFGHCYFKRPAEISQIPAWTFHIATFMPIMWPPSMLSASIKWK